MKKLTLLAAMAVCGMGAMNAQLVDPSLNQTINNGEIFDVFMLLLTRLVLISRQTVSLASKLVL